MTQTIEIEQLSEVDLALDIGCRITWKRGTCGKPSTVRIRFTCPCRVAHVLACGECLEGVRKLGAVCGACYKDATHWSLT